MPYAMIVQPQPKIEKATNAHDAQFLRCKLTPEKHLTKSYETMTYHKTMSIDFAKQLRSSSMCSKFILNRLKWFGSTTFNRLTMGLADQLWSKAHGFSYRWPREAHAPRGRRESLVYQNQDVLDENIWC